MKKEMTEQEGLMIVLGGDKPSKPDGNEYECPHCGYSSEDVEDFKSKKAPEEEEEDPEEVEVDDVYRKENF